MGTDMSVIKVDISFVFIAKDDTASDKEQFKVTKTVEGNKGDIPSSTWQVSCVKNATDEKWKLHVDLLEYETFKNSNVVATGKALIKFGGDSTECVLATTELKDLMASGRVWTFEQSEMAKGLSYSVDVKITLTCNQPPLTSSVSKLQSDFAALFENGKNTDLVLVAEDKEFKVHKLILKSRSEVFERMLEADMKEKQENRIVIEDVKSGVLEVMLMFIYNGTLEENIDKEPGFLEDLFNASEKYALTDLKKLVAQKMCSGMTIQNVGKRFLLADQFSAKELRNKCFQFIRDHCDALCKQDKSFLF